jgi:hypothetical protein
MTAKQIGFGGQWIDGTPIGEHTDSDGDLVNIDTAFLEAVVANFNQTKHLHEPPAVIGHPKADAPAYGYVEELRVHNGRLQRKFSQVNPQFEELVKTGAYKKRSDAFYLDPAIAPGGLVPALRHVGFLGAQPPAIKGIQDIHFAGDGGKTVSVEVDTAISFSEGDASVTIENKNEKPLREQIADFFREAFSKDEKPKGASFSEADQQALIVRATAAAEAKFSEELKKRDTKIEELTTQVQSQVGSSARAEIVAFCESLPATIVPAIKRMNIVGFMERLAGRAEKKIAVITFAEDGKTEKTVEVSDLQWFQDFLKSLPPFIQFGEKFGDVKLTGDGSDVTNPGQVKNMLSSMGVTGEKK